MEGGKWVGCCDKAGYERMAGIKFPCERWSAVVAAMEISKCVMKNHKHRRRCITSASLRRLFDGSYQAFIVTLKTNAAVTKFISPGDTRE